MDDFTIILFETFKSFLLSSQPATTLLFQCLFENSHNGEMIYNSHYLDISLLFNVHISHFFLRTFFNQDVVQKLLDLSISMGKNVVITIFDQNN